MVESPAPIGKKSSVCADYSAYTRSPAWLARRARYFSRYKVRACACCGDTGRLDLHHLTYARVGAERDDDLTAVCRTCHYALHKFPERRQRQLAPPASLRHAVARLASKERSREASDYWREQRRVRYKVSRKTGDLTARSAPPTQRKASLKKTEGRMEPYRKPHRKRDR